MKKGTLLCISAAVLFGLVPPAMNYLLLHGVSKTSALLGPNFFLFTGSFALCRLHHWDTAVPVRNATLLLLVGMLGMGGTNLLISSAFLLLPVGVVTTIHFLYPTIVTFTEIAFLGKRFTITAFGAAFFSLAGIACVSASGISSGGSLLGYVLALASSLTYSFFIIGSERGKPADLHPAVGLFWLSGGAMIMALLCAVSVHPFVWPAYAPLWCVYALYCMTIGSAFGMLFTGISSVGAVNAAFATLLEPLTAVVCGVVIFSESVTLFSVLGFAMVLTSVYLNSR